MKEQHNKQTKLEDYEPGATKTQVLADLKKVATMPRPSRKRVEPPAPTSK